MLSLGVKKISSRGVQVNFTSLRNVRRNGVIPDAKAARAARKDKIVRPMTDGRTFPVLKSAVAGVVLSLAGYGVYSIRTDRNGLLVEMWQPNGDSLQLIHLDLANNQTSVLAEGQSIGNIVILPTSFIPVPNTVSLQLPPYHFRSD